MNVDLPAPFGPRSATISPASISRSTPSTRDDSGEALGEAAGERTRPRVRHEGRGARHRSRLDEVAFTVGPALDRDELAAVGFSSGTFS